MAVNILILLIVMAFTLIPIVWIVLESFKPEDQWVSNPPVWIPTTGRFRATGTCGTTAAEPCSSTASSWSASRP